MSKPGYPDRYTMVRAAIYMERQMFSYCEWPIVARLCDSDVAIRSYILDYVEDILNMWYGLKPTAGSFAYEIALTAAYNAYQSAKRHIQDDDRVKELIKPMTPFTQEEYDKAKEKYYSTHPNSRVTARLIASLERESAFFEHKTYFTKSGCKIIPISVGIDISQKKR